MAVGARAFDVLLALIERHERLVTKDELVELVWPGLVVEENNLQVQISALRKLLGAQAIATIPGRGYRFTGSLENRAAARIDAPVTDAKSVAVLPFENLSAEADNAYFAQGMQSEILTSLSKVGGLKVISRASTAGYPSRPANLPELAQSLGVAHVLKGSVQKLSNRARINVQLVRAEDETQLWAETYDRQLDDLFSVQSDVAERIVESLHARLTGVERQALATKPTGNTAAYDAYLRGLIFEQQPGLTLENLRAAAGFYSQALALDPGFALAWARRSSVDSNLYHFNYERTPLVLERARQAAEIALKLQPELGEAFVALGYYRYQGKRDYGGALRAFEEARRRLPNSADVPAGIAIVERRQGRFEDAARHLQQALQLDPRNKLFLQFLAEILLMQRRFDESVAVLDHGLAMEPANAVLLALKAECCQALGQMEKAAAILATLPLQPDDWYPFLARIHQWLLERRFEPAIEALQTALARRDLNVGIDVGNYYCLLGLALQRSGRAEAAHAAFMQGRDRLEAMRNGTNDDEPRVPAFLGLVYAGLGDKPAALRAGKEAAALAARDCVDGPGIHEALAMVYAEFGEADTALTILAPLLQVSYLGLLRHPPATPALLRRDPAWDPLRGDPRFQQLMDGGPRQ